MLQLISELFRPEELFVSETLIVENTFIRPVFYFETLPRMCVVLLTVGQLRLSLSTC